jgi:superfamily II DNA or RNA helicase
VGERALNRLVMLEGHFTRAVRVESYEEIAPGILHLQVRHSSGVQDETDISADDLAAILTDTSVGEQRLVKPQDLFLWVESQRIRLAFAHDPMFAVSLSGVRGLPHQIEAVYRWMLPQPRLRFVLADDPGAGKTIMGGLLLKELRLRSVVERCLILCPAPLTMQWQSELLDKFDESFEIVSSEQIRHQVGRNPWQRFPQVIASIDFAKQDGVREELLRAEWDLVIVDEAHKASARSKNDDSVEKTRRYQVVEGVSRQAERLLLLTATPHSGDEDRFTRFLGLLDPDQFATPDLVRKQIEAPDNPYFLRRLKEDLKDERGNDLFVRRHVHTQPFQMSTDELQLYRDVTTHVNKYLGTVGGSRGNAVALARTVLQRRMASSVGAIRSSLIRRADKLTELADQLETMKPAEQQRRLAGLGRIPAGATIDDLETGSEDVDERTDDYLATQVSTAAEVGQLRTEVTALRRLINQAERVAALGQERKLAALDECLKRTQFAELRDGHGKLLIFTEHRDTLNYLADNLAAWGYRVCTIHGGHSPADRRRIQQEFRQSAQVCVATEAAGEGINLQFCHLVINYDLPWNPVRLEQRMGRVHRIGQTADCWVFNFCATNTVEGDLLAALHLKLEAMAVALHGRVYDVIGDLLAINGLDFERLVRDTLANPTASNVRRAKDAINKLDATRLEAYEKATGVALAKKWVDTTWVRGANVRSEEKRLMPEYVEAFFLAAGERTGMRIARRVDGLLRIDHVPVALRSEDLTAVKQRGRPDPEYRKLTFRKEQRELSDHEEAALCSPGHPLFAAVTEAMEREMELVGVPQAGAAFVDPVATKPYYVHLFAHEIVGESTHGTPEPAFAEVVAILDDEHGLEQAPADVLHTLTPAPDRQDATPPAAARIKAATDWLRVHVQMPATGVERKERLAQADLRRKYLGEAMDAQQERLQQQWQAYDEKVNAGDESYRLQRDNTARRLSELRHRRSSKLEALQRLGVVRPGKVTHLGTACVLAPALADDPDVTIMRANKEVEEAAVAAAMAYEREDGWTPEYVGDARDGSGFDIRSRRSLSDGTEQVRRIEVKGRGAPSGDVGLYRTEWYAAQRWEGGFWLYVVYDALGRRPNLVRVQDPYHKLANVTPITQITGYRVPGASIEAYVRTAGEAQ